jgi:hypothetical protein
MSRIKRFGIGLATVVMTGVPPAIAQPIFENWNTETCGFTRTATFGIDQTTLIERIEIWYNWRSGETRTSYTASVDGQVAFSGTLVRAECDAYQRSWCIGRDQPGKELAPGDYTIRTPRAAICQNAASDGDGFVRVFGRPR